MLDTDCDGLMIPLVDTPEQARQIVAAARFHPLGGRSFGGRRVIDRAGRDYYQTANDRVLVMAQIESPQAIDNAAAIVAVDGIDCLFFGGDDVKMRLDLPIDAPASEPKLRAALEKVARAAAAANKLCGCVAGSRPIAEMVVEMGYRIIVGGGDVSLLRVASQAKLQELQPLRQERAPGKSGAAGSVY